MCFMLKKEQQKPEKSAGAPLGLWLFKMLPANRFAGWQLFLATQEYLSDQSWSSACSDNYIALFTDISEYLQSKL